MQLRLIRNATFVLDFGGHRLLVDPFFAPKHVFPSFAGVSKNPTVDLPYPSEEIMDGVEVVIVSHLHPDHFDPVAQEQLPKSLPIFCQPGDDDAIRSHGFDQVHPITDAVEWHNIRITRIDGHHGLGPVEQEMGVVSGFVFEAANEPKVYWAGDTVLCEEVETAIHTHAPDIIITHSAGAMWPDPQNTDQRVLIIMDAAQTIDTAKIAPQSRLVAIHMEALDHGTVSRSELRQAASDANIPEHWLLIPADGETLELV
ncbi:MAG: MBL fold metallo-hydrolase [Chloroflexota bacterium]